MSCFVSVLLVVKDDRRVVNQTSYDWSSGKQRTTYYETKQKTDDDPCCSIRLCPQIASNKWYQSPLLRYKYVEKE